jgi:YHS domain-containing protein
MKFLFALVALVALSTAAQAGDTPKPYPLKTCLISGEKLGEMGAPTVLVYEGQEYKFCCKSCEKKFQADPAKYTKELNKAGS